VLVVYSWNIFQCAMYSYHATRRSRPFPVSKSSPSPSPCRNAKCFVLSNDLEIRDRSPTAGWYVGQSPLPRQNIYLVAADVSQFSQSCITTTKRAHYVEISRASELSRAQSSPKLKKTLALTQQNRVAPGLQCLPRSFSPCPACRSAGSDLRRCRKG